MDEAWQRRVRERAYALWEREGCPEGHAERHWFRTEAELLRAEEAHPSAGPAARPGERHPWTEEAGAVMCPASCATGLAAGPDEFRGAGA
jgi:hypothetical protein